MATYSATDVANFFIDYYARSVDPMNLPRVQYFCYFAQVESLCRNGTPIIEDTFRAYPTGPALTRLECYYDGAGNMPIKVHREFDKSIFSKEDLKLLMDVAIYYNTFSTSELQIMSYVSNGPWQYVYSQGTDLLGIDNEYIKAFYERLPRIPNYREQVLAAIHGCCEIETMPVLRCEEVEPIDVNTPSEVSTTWE
ncbi:MAG: DUF4065 domain-containing protein [Candidatus Methanomethylophilaceae archaeon]|nr:DUF4065 domain-containing protein [Candidatus Methanomethylophilaceae archaeon]MBP5685938.1 DUF4065 domain-containing protein [Candidatus Methanomethylophilaceae archaeon]